MSKTPKHRDTFRRRLFSRRFLSRRFLVFSLLVAGTAFTVGTVISQTIPKVKSWLLVSIDKFSRDNLPVRILPGAVDFRFFPLGITLNDVRILPTEEFEKENGNLFSALTIQEVRADLSMLQIIRGEVALDEVSVSGTEVRIVVPKPKASGGKPLDGLFKALDKVPIGTFMLSDINAFVEVPHEMLSLEVENLKFQMDRTRVRSLPKVELNASAASVVFRQSKKGSDPGLVLRLTPALSLNFTPDRIDIEKLELRRGSSVINLNGILGGDTEGLEFTAGGFDVSSDLDVKSTRDWLQKSIADAEPTPPMSGRLRLTAKLEKAGKPQPWTAAFKISTDDYHVQYIDLDKIEASGKWDGEQIFIPSITSVAQAGKVELREVRIGEGMQNTPEGRTPWLMRIGLLKADIDLHDFLTNMGIGPIPVWLSAQGAFPCESQLAPKFMIRCGGEFNGQNLIVQNNLKAGRSPNGAIAGIPTFTSKGEFSFDLEKFRYSADIQFPNSIGKSTGEVRYKSGFDIKYEADRLAIKDLSALGGLKLEGLLKLKGSTVGNSSSASLTMDLEGQDLWLENFWLGQPKGVATYKAGHLTFTGLQGFYTTSRYNGDVKIDLLKSTIETSLRLPFFDSRDLFKVFSRKFTSPVAVTGTGQASIKSSGPFDISRMTYDLKSSLFKGTVAGENFDQIHFDVKSLKGEVKSERVLVNRGEAVIQLTGVGRPDGTIDTVVRGRGFRLEETNLVSESGFGLDGLLSFDMLLKGPVLAPDADLTGSLTRTSIAETSVPDSNFKLRFTSKTIEGEGTLLGDLLTGEFIWPLANEAPMSIKLQTREWNFAPIFSAIAGPSGRKDFEGRLTSNIDLKSSRGGFWASNGTITIDRLSLRRGPIELSNPRKLTANMKNGLFSIRDFELAGDGTFIKINDQPTADQSGRNLDLQINSKIDMNLLSIFTPFFEELRGLLSMAVSLKMGPGGSDVIGSAYIDRAFIKFPEFSHAFENLQSDLVFNHKKVVINSIKSDFAGGKIQALGGLEFQGKKQVPVNVTGSFDRITLNLPDKVRSSGSGNFTFSGAWFPFLLKGNYIVREGLFAMELDGAGSSGKANEALRRDQFLPKFLVEDSFQPLLLDINVDFSKGVQAKNEMIEGSATGTMQVEGNPTKPKLKGQVRANTDTKIKFRENIFDVSSAILTFDDPLEINPRINLNARTRVDGYDVNLLVQGTGKKPEISVSSIPPMPERDILSLLALGTTDRSLTTTDGGNQQGTAAGQQLISGVANQALKGVTKKLGVDVQLSPGFDDTNGDYQKVILKIPVNRKLDLSASQTLGKTPESEVVLRYRFTDRVSGVLRGQFLDRGEVSDSTGQQFRNSDRGGLDFEYKFEFK